MTKRQIGNLMCGGLVGFLDSQAGYGLFSFWGLAHLAVLVFALTLIDEGR